MHAGVAKAWHLHATHYDWWYVVTGRLLVALYDLREEAPTYGQLDELILGDEPAVLCIPIMVAHGCKALTEVHMYLGHYPEALSTGKKSIRYFFKNIHRGRC